MCPWENYRIVLICKSRLIWSFLIYSMELVHKYTPKNATEKQRIINLLLIKGVRIQTTLTKIKLIPWYKYQGVTVVAIFLRRICQDSINGISSSHFHHIYWFFTALRGSNRIVSKFTHFHGNASIITTISDYYLNFPILNTACLPN